MIEFLFWEGCPSHERALENLIGQMDELGLERDDLRITEVRTEADSERENFVGSPTVRIGGKDIQDPGDEPLGLNCRVYRHRDGRRSPLPDSDDLRELLSAYARDQQGD